MRIQAVVLAGCLSLVGCGEVDNDIEQDLQIDRSGTKISFVAKFAPGDSVIPFPTNLLFTPDDGQVPDGTLNIPVEDVADLSDPKVALNALDGFSTMAPISTTFSQPIDPATLNGATVRMFEVTLGAVGNVESVDAALVFGVDYFVSLSPLDTSNQTVVISPLKPLKPKTGYMVAMSSGIQSTDGRSAAAETTYQLVKRTTPLFDGTNSLEPTLTAEQAGKLEGLRQLTNIQELQLAGQGLSSDQVVLSWTFSTQSIEDVLVEAKAQSTSATSTIYALIGDTAALLEAGPGLANVYAGSLTVPYYLTNASASPLDPLSKSWLDADGAYLTANTPTPMKTSDEVIPLLLSVPKTGAAPWPVVIFQHGITSDRSAMLAIADALASVGFAAVAIDMPLHGLATGHPLRLDDPEGLNLSVGERTFDLDLVENVEGAPSIPGPDGTADSSGTHYINLSNLLVTRDNVRQSVADLFALHEALATMDYDGGGAGFDTSNIYFIGHSLGAMVGVPFLALEPNIKEAVLGMPGGGIAKLLDGSATFGPIIAAGLGAKGVVKGTADYESFMGAAQTVVDAADPNNYAAAAVANRGVLLFEVTGDEVIPNNVLADAPEGTLPSMLAGTDPLRTLMGLTQLSASNTEVVEQDVYIRLAAGLGTNHRSLLDPEPNATATSMMQTAIATFLASSGLVVTVNDTSVVE